MKRFCNRPFSVLNVSIFCAFVMSPSCFSNWISCTATDYDGIRAPNCLWKNCVSSEKKIINFLENFRIPVETNQFLINAVFAKIIIHIFTKKRRIVDFIYF